MLTVGDLLPEFKCKACVGTAKEDLTEINSGTHEGKYDDWYVEHRRPLCRRSCASAVALG